MNEQDQFIDSLEASFSDPKIDELIKNACTVNEYLEEPTTTEADAIDIASELNKNLSKLGLKKEQVFITGSGWLVSSGDTDEDDNLIIHESARMNFVDQEVHLFEFVMHEFQELSEEGVTTNRKVYLAGRTPIESDEESDDDEDDNDMGGFNVEECFIAVTPDMIIRHEGLNECKADAWLEMYFPDQKEALFELCANAEDEAGILFNLKEHEIDVSGIDKRTADDLTANVEVYLKEQLNLNDILPYIVKFSGELQTLSSDDALIEMSSTKLESERFVYIYDIAYIYDHETETLQPWAEGALVKKSGLERVSCKFPVTSIAKIESLKDLLNR